jgi:CRISP-associated protein Cas1
MELNISTFGTYLHVKDELFEVRVKDAATQEVRKQQFAATKVSRIVLSKGVALSTDAVHLAMLHHIDILFVENDGFPIGRVWHSKLGSTTKIRKRQLEASLNTIGVVAIKTWIAAKVENQTDFVRDLKKHRAQHADFLNDKIKRMEALQVSVLGLEGDTVSAFADTLRGLEGTAGRLYFETLAYVLPPDYKFSGRSSRPAQDAFNAFLNYAYGVLYSRIEKALIIAGLDPYVGFLHRDDYNQLSFVFDFIEPYRIFADTVVFRLFSAKKVNKAHIDALANGVTLNKEGKTLLITAFNAYFDDDPIRHKGKNQTRANVIQSDAHGFANSLILK